VVAAAVRRVVRLARVPFAVELLAVVRLRVVRRLRPGRGGVVAALADSDIH
jgi:hypothetical protein